MSFKFTKKTLKEYYDSFNGNSLEYLELMETKQKIIKEAKEKFPGIYDIKSFPLLGNDAIVYTQTEILLNTEQEKYNTMIRYKEKVYKIAHRLLKKNGNDYCEFEC